MDVSSGSYHLVQSLLRLFLGPNFQYSRFQLCLNLPNYVHSDESACSSIFTWCKWKTLKCGNRSTEMEVRKPKYGSEKKSRLSMFSAFLTHKCVCWGLVDKRELNLCDVRAGSLALGLRRPLLSQIVQCACDSQTQTKTNGECMGQSCGLYAPGMSWQRCRCECCHSSSPMAQPATKTLANTSRNETKTRLHAPCHPKQLC